MDSPVSVWFKNLDVRQTEVNFQEVKSFIELTEDEKFWFQKLDQSLTDEISCGTIYSEALKGLFVEDFLILEYYEEEVNHMNSQAKLCFAEKEKQFILLLSNMEQFSSGSDAVINLNLLLELHLLNAVETVRMIQDDLRKAAGKSKLDLREESLSRAKLSWSISPENVQNYVEFLNSRNLYRNLRNQENEEFMRSDFVPMSQESMQRELEVDEIRISFFGMDTLHSFIVAVPAFVAALQHAKHQVLSYLFCRAFIFHIKR
eukprot:snap_masked-scaffold_11-processed-gene-6.17-mRNA-1 protein AED:1.00 eAED:1.00 QI:0/0/0/0/1/1/2/0/259